MISFLLKKCPGSKNDLKRSIILASHSFSKATYGSPGPFWGNGRCSNKGKDVINWITNTTSPLTWDCIIVHYQSLDFLYLWNLTQSEHKVTLLQAEFVIHWNCITLFNLLWMLSFFFSFWSEFLEFLHKCGVKL